MHFMQSGTPYSADMCTGKFQLVPPMGDEWTRQTCADGEQGPPSALAEISKAFILYGSLEYHARPFSQSPTVIWSPLGLFCLMRDNLYRLPNVFGLKKLQWHSSCVTWVTEGPCRSILVKTNNHLVTNYILWPNETIGDRSLTPKSITCDDNCHSPTQPQKWKVTSKKNGRRPQKPINQNQPNWLWHHCKFT
jgi:hypothetical protein